MEDTKIDTSCLFSDLHYTVDVDYNTEYSCEYDCIDDYCRCGRIVDTKIGKIPCDKLAEDIAPSELFLKYCVERVLLHFKPLHDNCNWDIEVEGGYYGQELGAVTLHKDVAEILSNILLSLEEATDTQRVETILTMEYGFVLPTLKGKSWSLERISLDEVELGQKAYAADLDEERIANYTKNEKIIAGIVVESGGKYRVVDGYHRVTAAKRANKNRAIWFLVGR